jgi:recombination protein RecT
VANMQARIVYKDDHFVYQEGMEPKLEHTPNYDVPLKDENIIGAYSIADFCDEQRRPIGFKDAHFLTAAKLKKVRDKSPAGKSGPWVDHFDEMCLKTVIKHHAKTLPQSVELATALELDNRAEMLKPQHLQITQTAELTAIDMAPLDDEEQNAGAGDLTQNQQKPAGSKLDAVVDANKKGNETESGQGHAGNGAGGETKSAKPETKSPAGETAGAGNTDADPLRVIEPEALLTQPQKDFLDNLRTRHNIDANVWIAWARKRFDVKMASKILQKHFADARAWCEAGGKEPA